MSGGEVRLGVTLSTVAQPKGALVQQVASGNTRPMEVRDGTQGLIKLCKPAASVLEPHPWKVLKHY